jgi:hypothetical protein
MNSAKNLDATPGIGGVCDARIELTLACSLRAATALR